MMHVRAGDLVTVETQDRRLTGTVVRVFERPGRTSNGLRHNPLVTILDPQGEALPFDNAYVCKVISRHNGPKAAPVNVYKYPRLSGGWFRQVRNGVPTRGILCGSILGIAENILAHATGIMVPRPLEKERLVRLFLVQTPGLVRYESPHGHLDPETYYIRVKPFKAWLLRNLNRLIMTQAEVAAPITAMNKRLAEQYYESLYEPEED